MVIAPIGPLPSLPSLPSLGGASGPGSTLGAGSGGFSNLITGAIDALQQSQTTASSAEANAAAGQGNLANTMIAASKASLDTQVSTDLINKAVASYTSIMSMSF